MPIYQGMQNVLLCSGFHFIDTFYAGERIDWTWQRLGGCETNPKGNYCHLRETIDCSEEEARSRSRDLKAVQAAAEGGEEVLRLSGT